MAEDKFVLARSPSQRALEEADSDDDEADPQVVAVLVTAAEQVQHILTAQPVYSQEKTGPELEACVMAVRGLLPVIDVVMESSSAPQQDQVRRAISRHVDIDTGTHKCRALQSTATGDLAPCHFNCAGGAAECKKHWKNQSFLAWRNNKLTTFKSVQCAMCGDDAAHRCGKEVVRCFTCPITWHRECLIDFVADCPWETDNITLGDFEAIACSRCVAYRRPWWNDREKMLYAPVTQDLHANDEKLNLIFQHEFKRRFAIHPAPPPLRDAPPPTLLKGVTPAEQQRIMERRRAKGVGTALRDEAAAAMDQAANTLIPPGPNAPTPGALGAVFAQMDLNKTALLPGGDPQQTVPPDPAPGLPAVPVQVHPQVPEASLSVNGTTGPTGAVATTGVGPASASAQGASIVINNSNTDSMLQELLRNQQSLAKELAALKGASQGGSRATLPRAPPPDFTGPKEGYDVDGFHLSDEGHIENRNFAQGEAYHFMAEGKPYAKRCFRLARVERIDYASSNRYTPEEEATMKSVTVGGVEMFTTGSAKGIAMRAPYEAAVILRFNEITAYVLSGRGVFSESFEYHDYHTTIATLVCGRYVFLLATIDYLTHFKVPQVMWDYVWRYVIRIVNDNFTNQAPSSIGLDGDIMANFKLGCGTEARGSPYFRNLARNYLERSTLDDVMATAQLALAGQPAGGKPKANAGAERCTLCGKTSCGLYSSLTSPPYQCTNPVTQECSKCKDAGYPKLMHARSGPRAMVNGRVKSCLDYRKEVDAKK